MAGFFQLPFGVAPIQLLANALQHQPPGVQLWLPTERARRQLLRLLRPHQQAAAPDIRLLQLGWGITDARTDEAQPATTLPPKTAALLATSQWLVQQTDAKRSWQSAVAMAEQLLQLHQLQGGESLDWQKLASIDSASWSEQILTGQQLLQQWQTWWHGWLHRHGYHPLPVVEDAALQALQQAWQSSPPTAVWLIGADGSLALQQKLMALVAQLPQGAVLLPPIPDGITAEALPAHHPYHPLLQFLRGQPETTWPLPLWPLAASQSLPSPRQQLLNSWFAPKTAPEHALPHNACDGLTVIPCADLAAEAAMIAQLVQHALAQPDHPQIALLTPDRQLAVMVAANLRRWGLAVDDSAGQPLQQTPLGRLVLLSLAAMQAEVDAVAVLALLYHPLCRLGMTREAVLAQARAMDRAWRGLPIAPGYNGLIERFAQSINESSPADDSPAVLSLLQQWQARQPLPPATLTQWLDWHQALLQLCLQKPDEEHGDTPPALAPDDPCLASLQQLWQDLTDAAPHAEGMEFADYQTLLTTQLAGLSVRTPTPERQASLMIWGVFEGRLQHPDLLILGGCNDGIWPAIGSAGSVNPWLPANARQALGLAGEAEAVAAAGYDFLQNLQSPKLLITFANSRDGTPTPPCTWLIQLQALLTKQTWQQSDAAPHGLPSWAQLTPLQLDIPAPPPTPSRITQLPPAPNPPPALRPRRLSASQLTQLMTDPYSYYAAQLLRLHPLAQFDDHAETPRALGTMLHRVLEDFGQQHGVNWPSDAPEQLRQGLAQRLGSLAEHPLLAYHWQRLLDAVRWLDSQERRRRAAPPGIAKLWVEQRGQANLTLNGEKIALHAKADRIEMDANGAFTLLDYKTGALPSKTSIRRGLAPQLLLEAWLLQHGRFAWQTQTPPATQPIISDLIIWRLNGGENGGDDLSFVAKFDLPTLMQEFNHGMLDLLQQLVLTPTPYHPDPWPDVPPRAAYAHLKRRAAWV